MPRTMAPIIVTMKRGRVKPLVYRHPWVFSASIERVDGSPEDGDAVVVHDPSGRFLAAGHWNGRSQLRVRLFSWDPAVTDLDAAEIRARIAAAAAFRRERLGLPEPGRTTGYRVVHAEADFLPGLVVDRVGEVLAIQISTAGMERRRGAILDALEAELAPRAIVELDDPEMRAREGLAPAASAQRGEPPAGPVVVLENGLAFEADLAGGQKTGFFFDQRENRAAAAALARGRTVLDGFAYTGAFAVSCAKAGAAQVTAVESSAAAVEVARRNAARNGVAPEIIQEDVYRFLGRAREERRTWDLVILDPPKYAPSRAALEKALQKYKELFALGVRVTSPGGVLVACSCSGLVDEPMLDAVLLEVAHETRRDLRVFRRGGQAPDHPVAITCPESRYLQAVFCHVP
jgi:23S rRNA (cytosine1962-C5)-methyltransferase